MSDDSLQSLCERGQTELIATDYLDAENTLQRAESIAVQAGDLDALSRLYMPLQEARRQRRQRCGEGTIHMSLVARGPEDSEIDPVRLIEQYPHGQLLIAGWGSITPGIEFRKLAHARSLYVETYLAAVFQVDGQQVIAIFPSDESLLPPPEDRASTGPIAPSPDIPSERWGEGGFEVRNWFELRNHPHPHPLPDYRERGLDSVQADAFVIPAAQLPSGPQAGTDQTYAYTQELWERLHRPFLNRAESQTRQPRADSILSAGAEGGLRL